MGSIGRKGVQNSNRRTPLKGFAAALVYMVFCFAALYFLYPELYRYSSSQALPEYFLMSFIVTCIVVLVVPLVTWWCNRLEIWMAVIIRTVSTSVIMWILATSMNDREFTAYWPASQLTSFFSELRVIIFAYVFTPIVSLLAGVYYSFTFRRRVVTSSPERYATRGRSRERKRDK